MAKKIKIQDPQRKKIFTMIGEILSGRTTVDFNTDSVDLYREIVLNDGGSIRKIRNYNTNHFVKTTLDGVDGLMIFSIMEFPMNEKDSIKINDHVVKTIDFFEKLLVSIDKVSIKRHNIQLTNSHLVFLKMFKSMDVGILKSIKLDNTLDTENLDTDVVRKPPVMGTEADDFADHTL